MQPVKTTPKVSLDRWLQWFPLPLFCIALGYYLWAISAGWNNTIADHHSFRQTQTAISTFYMVNQPLKLAYETPVLGPPWSIPMEFPLYQWVVVGLVKAFGMALDQAGRLASVTFFLMSLVPGYFILGSLRVVPLHRLAALALLLACPFYTFWSRTFMIETCGLFFAMSYLACALEARRKCCFILACIFGVLAALVKITTFLPFAVGAGLFLMRDFLRPPWRWRAWREWLPPLSIASLLAGIPLASGITWAHYADHLKQQNALGVFITSKSLDAWNFGTLAQKTSWDTWWAILGRSHTLFAPPVIFWAASLMALLLLGSFHQRWKEIMLCILLFLLAPALLTNLHFQHDYYMCANGVFLLGAAGFLLLSVLENPKFRPLGMLIAGASLVAGIFEHQAAYLPLQRQNANAFLPLARQIRDSTPPDAVNIYVGLDWNPMLPYYSERRALMIPEWIDLKLSTSDVQMAFRNLQGQKVGIVLISPSSRWTKDSILEMMKEANLPLERVYSLN
jgi:hypothetical protein